MRHFSKLILPLAALLAALTLASCGKTDVITCYAETEDGSGSGEVTAAQIAEWDVFPQVYIHYEDEDFQSSAQLTISDCFTWGATRTDGTHGIAECDGARPYQMENLCTITMADKGGTVRLAIFHEIMPAVENAEFYAAEALTDLTLTAYPVAEDGTPDLAPETAQTLPVTKGRFTMLVGSYYYELTVPQNGGVLTYGFMAQRIDKEEYELRHYVSNGASHTYHEDPDYYTKMLSTIRLEKPYGYEVKTGITLSPCGTIRKTYQNYAGTEIWMTQNNNAIKGKYIRTVDAAFLTFPYTVVFDSTAEIERAFYNRYAYNGTHLEGDVVISANNEITFEENSYYVFTVIYEDGSVQYTLKTGALEIAPHERDDPSIDPETAKLLRSEYLAYFGHAYPVSRVYIERYLGNYSGMEAVFFAGIDTIYGEMVRRIPLGDYVITFPNTHRMYLYLNSRFYTLSEAYEAGLLSNRDIYDLGVLLNGETFTAAYPTPPEG